MDIECNNIVLVTDHKKDWPLGLARFEYIDHFIGATTKIETYHQAKGFNKIDRSCSDLGILAQKGRK